MDQLFVLVHRRLDGYTKIHVIHDLVEAVVFQKALIASDSPTLALLEIVKQTISDSDIQAVTDNLNQTRIDRLCNDEEEVSIIFFPKRGVVR